MSRFLQEYEDRHRLPEGMKRIAYDSDIRVYTFRDRAGVLYYGAPGEEYGVLTTEPQKRYTSREGAFDDGRPKTVNSNLNSAVSFSDFLPTSSITKAEHAKATTAIESDLPKHLFSYAAKRVTKLQRVLIALRTKETNGPATTTSNTAPPRGHPPTTRFPPQSVSSSKTAGARFKGKHDSSDDTRALLRRTS